MLGGRNLVKNAKGALLVIAEQYLPTVGGTATWFDEVYRHMGGKEIHIVTTKVAGALEHDIGHPNSVYRISLRRYLFLRPESLIIYLKLLARALHLAIINRVSAIHTGKVLPEGIVGWLIAKAMNIPLVIYAHGEEITTWRQPGKFKAMKFTYTHADRIIANSKFTRDELVSLGVKPDNIVLINPGVNIHRFRAGLATDDLRVGLGLQTEQKLIISVGRLTRRKGFDYVIRAIPRIVAQGIDVHHVVIGIGEDMEYLTTLTEELEVSDRCHLLGYVNQEDLPRWYNLGDVFAMPNREIGGDTEGFGMVFMEAAACGLATVAGIAGGTAAAVVDGLTGLRIDATSVEEVSGALVRLLKDDKLRGQLGENAMERAKKEFSWETVARKTIEMT